MRSSINDAIRLGLPTKLAYWPTAVFIGAVTFVLRAVNLGRSYDIFVDEVTYLEVSQSVASKLELRVYGEPFYIHPPAFFFLEGAYIKSFLHRWGLHPHTMSDLVHLIYEVRQVNAVLAGLTAIALFGIGRQLGGWSTGVLAAGLFALEPFVIRMNSRNYLDTGSMIWVALGYYVLFSALSKEKRTLSPRRMLMAGVLFGLALLNKEMTSFVTLLPLAVCFFMGWSMPRVQSALIGTVALLAYSTYPITIYAVGHWDVFYSKKLEDVLRITGALKPTGFREGGPSFLQAILSNLETLGSTYALLGTGAVSVLILFFCGKGASNRLLVVWTASTYALLAFLIAKGNLEEQFFYFLIIPAIISTAVSTKLVLRLELISGRLRQGLVAIAIVLGTTFFCWSGYVWVKLHFTPDNGIQRVVSYLGNELPKGSLVAATDDNTFVLTRGYVVNKYDSREELRRHDIQYVVMSSKNAEQGYGEPPQKLYDWVADHGKLVYSFEGRSFGLLGIWRLPDKY